MDENNLSHYGVKGMKWGIRHPRIRKGSGPRRVASDYKKTQHLRGKDPKTLTNKQLQDLNNRLNLEQSYARLNPGTTELGRRKAQAALATIGIGVSAYNLLNSPAGKALRGVGKKHTNQQLKLF